MKHTITSALRIAKATGGGAKQMRTIWLVRHGATKLNNDTDVSQDKIRAWRDIPLSPEGVQDAKDTAKEICDSGIRRIVSSDLKRAAETAQIIGKACGARVEFTMALRPWQLGEFTGKSTQQALPEIKRYVEDHPDKPVPGGESFDQFKARAFKGVLDAIEKFPDVELCLVSHHRIERLLKAWIKAGHDPDGEVDLGVMTAKGDKPGKADRLTINVDALRKVVKGSRSDRAAVHDSLRGI